MVKLDLWNPAAMYSCSTVGQLSNGNTFTAPVEITLEAQIGVTGRELHAGDAVTVDYFAGSNLVASAKGNWQEEVNPSKHARPGQAVPMFIVPAHFNLAFTTWKDVSAGNYKVTAKATFGGLTAISDPIDIIVLAPLTNSPGQ